MIKVLIVLIGIVLCCVTLCRCTTNSKKYQTITVGKVKFRMVHVEGGTFTMGATAEQGDDAWKNEQPTHQVTLSSYLIGETEVTQQLWKAVMGDNPSNFKGNRRPVEMVSHNDALEFIQRLNQLTGLQFRLPTEAEWEYAARGGRYSKGYKYSGSNNIDEVAWYKKNCSRTHPVKQKQPNELGIYDMSGNVLEWCSDWYGAYSDADQTDPRGPASGSGRVLRGGCGNDSSKYCRTSFRFFFIPESRGSYGLRLVLNESPSKQTTTQQQTAASNSTYYQTFNIDTASFRMMRVEGGTFTMGATTEQGDNVNDYGYPTHQVTLSSYWMGETEVTQRLWKEVMGNNPSKLKGDDLPVEWVSYNDALEFIQKLNQRTGRRFRLPTEAEWEYAARGGLYSRGYKYSGANNIGLVAWFGENVLEGGTHSVGQKSPNELGLCDMSGNVWEWCSDWFGAYSSAAQTDPQGPAHGSKRVLRGGCWFTNERSCRSSTRFCDTPNNSINFFYGFRLALSE